MAGVEVYAAARRPTVSARLRAAADGAFRFEKLTLGIYRLSIPGITIDGIALDGWQTKEPEADDRRRAGYKYAVTRNGCCRRRRPTTGASSTASSRTRSARRSMASRCRCRGRGASRHELPGQGHAAAIRTSRRATTSSSTRPATFSLQVAQGDWPSDRGGRTRDGERSGSRGPAGHLRGQFPACSQWAAPRKSTASSTGARPAAKSLLSPLAGGRLAKPCSPRTARSPSPASRPEQYQADARRHRRDRARHRHHARRRYSSSLLALREPAQRQWWAPPRAS